MTATIVHAFLEHARREPERPAIDVGGAPPHSRGSIANEAMRIAAWLDASTPEGATVVTMGSSGPGFWAATLAVFGTGRRLLPITSSSLSDGGGGREGPVRAGVPGMVVTGLEAFGAAALIVHDESMGSGPLDRSPGARLSSDELPWLRAFDCGVTSGTCDVGASRRAARLERGHGASLLLRSSGTTGRARVVLREAAALDRVAATLAQVLGVDEADTIASHLPMHHSYGFEHTVLLPLLTGARVRAMERFAPDHLFASLRHDATVLPTVPVILQGLAEMAPEDEVAAEHPAGDRSAAKADDPHAEVASTSAPHRLRVVVSAGSPLPPVVRECFEQVWGVAVRNLYGASELGTIALTQGDGDRVVPGVAIKVCEPSIEERLLELAPGEVGELCVRSDAMFSGYLDADGTLDRCRIVDGHLRTGDAGAVDDAGRLSLRGRLRLQLDVGGLKVEPEVIEAVLAEHPLVREAVVVPLRMSETLTRLRAIVVRRGDPAPGDATELRAFLRQRVAAHEVPRVIDFVDQLPRSASGKLLRGRLL